MIQRKNEVVDLHPWIERNKSLSQVKVEKLLTKKELPTNGQVMKHVKQDKKVVVHDTNKYEINNPLTEVPVGHTAGIFLFNKSSTLLANPLPNISQSLICKQYTLYRYMKNLFYMKALKSLRDLETKWRSRAAGLSIKRLKGGE